jgi:hypothetical protein
LAVLLAKALLQHAAAVCSLPPLQTRKEESPLLLSQMQLASLMPVFAGPRRYFGISSDSW